jgi:hypothetical protein
MEFEPKFYSLGFSIDRQLYEDWRSEMLETNTKCSRILINARFWNWRIYFRWRAKHIKGKRFIFEVNRWTGV